MKRSYRILVADDDESILLTFRAIAKKTGYTLNTFADPLKALEYLQSEEPDLCIYDINMPGMNGLELLKRTKEKYPETEVIIISGIATVENAVTAIKEGAYDLIQKPFANLQLVISAMGRALEKRDLVKEISRLREADSDTGFCGIIGNTPAMQKIFSTIETVAISDSSVMITGESGTGKELVARAIHSRSKRNNAPFVPINCSAITETLFESELFGHIKGSFTGAFDNKKGLLEYANSGTVFLDEAGDIPLSIQVKLLRAIQEREIRRVGSNETIRIDVRFISATNKDLRQLIKEGRFREDLFYRLNVIEIILPPLRERREDILILASHFLRKYSLKQNKDINGFSLDTVAILENYNWPGNIRELENAIERSVVMCRGNSITVHDLPTHISKGYKPVYTEKITEKYRDARKRMLESFEKSYFEQLLNQTGGNISRASEIAGIDRSNLAKLLKKYPDVYKKNRE